MSDQRADMTWTDERLSQLADRLLEDDPDALTERMSGHDLLRLRDVLEERRAELLEGDE